MSRQRIIISAVVFVAATCFGWVVGSKRGYKGHASKGSKTLPTMVMCLLLFLPKKDRDPLLGDLEEEYPQVVAKFGERPANLWFYKQVLTSLWPMLQTAGRTLVKWGLIGWLEEVIRRIAH